MPISFIIFYVCSTYFVTGVLECGGGQLLLPDQTLRGSWAKGTLEPKLAMAGHVISEAKMLFR